MALFVLLALLVLTMAESRPFNPILLNTLTTEATTPALYWESTLPNTPMPNAITNLLQQGFTDDEYTSCEPIPSVEALSSLTAILHSKSDSKDTKLPVFYKSKDEKIPFSEDRLKNLLANIFFLEKDLLPGKSKELYFPKSCNDVPFIPRGVANSIPFSSDKLAEIHDELSLNPGSTIAEMMEETLSTCERSGIEGEKRRCVTSLESMIDFSTSVLGNNVRAISTEVDTRTPLRNYTISPEIKKMEGDKYVVCHKLNYAYAVFYCHSFPSITAYTVSMVGDDGTKAEAAAMCHGDTSAWDLNHMALRALKVKPGVSVCHFITPESIVWTNN